MKNIKRQTLHDILILIGCLLLAGGVTTLFFLLNGYEDKGCASVVFVLAVALTARFTQGYVWGIVSSVIGALVVNWAFTLPYMAFDITPQGYAVTFFVMLSVAVIISMLTTQVKHDSEIKAAAHREKLRADLLRSISHDIRTPLTAISTASGVFLENMDKLNSDTQRELISDVKHEADWLTRAFDNILTITRVGLGAEGFTKRPEAAEEVIGEVLALFKSRCPDITVEVVLPEELVMIPMDALLIEQVLKNLLENAADHGKGTTKITVTLEVKGDNAHFRVQDNGRGIAPELLGHLFNGAEMSRIKFSGDSSRGMGIGLELCSTVVKLHGGEMHGSNNKNGAVFEFTLPMK